MSVDPVVRRAQKRASEDRHRSLCIRCGEPCGSGSGWGKYARKDIRCVTCHDQHRRDLRDLWWLKIEALWHEGLGSREIARRLGMTVGFLRVSVARMRSEGWDLPYRHKAYLEEDPYA